MNPISAQPASYLRTYQMQAVNRQTPVMETSASPTEEAPETSQERLKESQSSNKIDTFA